MRKPILLLLIAAGASAQLQQSTFWQAMDPAVARPGQTVTFRACILNQAVTRVALESVVAGRPPIAELQRESGCVWRGTFVAPTPTVDDIFRPDFAFLRSYIGSNLFETANFFPEVLTPDIPILPVTSLGPTAQRTSYVVNLVLPQAYPPDSLALFDFNIQAVAQRFAQVMPDDYDQLNVVLTRGYLANRSHTNVRNLVSGIGAEIRMQPVRDFGASARLIGINMFPSPGLFDGAERTQSHEAVHQWVNYVTTGLLAEGGAHWPISTMASGVMGGRSGAFACTLRLEGGSLVVSQGPAEKQFNPLDLYFMGAIPASEVPDQYIVTDPAAVASLQQSCNHPPVPPSQFRVLRIADVVAALGPRVPDAASAPKSLRIATVVVSEHLLSQEEMSFYSFFARRAEERGLMWVKAGFGSLRNHPMFTASGGRFTLRTRLTSETLPEIAYGGVVSAAYTPDTALGGIVSIFGSDLANGEAAAPSYPLPSTLAGARVFVNGVAAPLYYASPGLVNFQMPINIPISPRGLATVRVETAAGASNVAYVNLRAVAPAVLFYGANRTVAVDAGFQVITESNPARHNRDVVLFFTGAGPTNPQFAAGLPAPSNPLARCQQPITVSLGNATIAPDFCGLAPGFSGLGQLNFRIPPEAGTGDVALRLRAGSVQSNETILAIQP